MHDLSRARSSIQALIGQRLSPLENVKTVLADGLGRSAKEDTGLLTIDWSTDARTLSQWLVSVLQRQPLAPQTRTLWFAVPEIELNEARTYCNAVSVWAPGDRESDWLCERGWTSTFAREPEWRGVLLPAMGAAQRVLEVGPEFDYDSKRLAGLDALLYTLPIVQMAAAVVAALPTIEPSLLLGDRDRVGAVVGFASGDWIVLGEIGRSGWLNVPFVE